MKKILTMALCLAAVGSMSAQKATVDQAKKLCGKIDKIEEVRGLILEASKNPETANDVYTYYVGGKAEYDAYDEAIKKRMINPNDKDVDPLAMGEQLVNGYKMFVKALPLDSVVDAKGKVNKIVKRYNALSEYDRAKIERWEDVVKTKTKLDNIVRAIVISVVLFVLAVGLTVFIIIRIRRRKMKKTLEMEELAAMYKDEDDEMR